MDMSTLRDFNTRGPIITTLVISKDLKDTTVIFLSTFLTLDVNVFGKNPIYSELFNLSLINFFNGLFHLSFLELSTISFGEIQMRIRTWSASSYNWVSADCTNVQAGLALYCRQRLITFASCRIRVKLCSGQKKCRKGDN